MRIEGRGNLKLLGQTPLSSLSLPQDQVVVLRSLWVETVEEAIALVAAVAGNGQLGTVSALRELSSGKFTIGVTQERLAALRQPRRGGGLGCILDPQAVETYRRDGRLRSPRPLPAGAFEDRLPRAVRVFDRMQPVRDQGERGTCVAFASVALREFLLSKRDDLSEQFMYWGCKELDGLPDAGTYIHTAMTVFAQYGVCPESVWPYEPHQTASEGQGPPPRGARDAAQAFRLASARTVEPGLVLHYKHVLAGEDGKGGMPVTFGVLVFDSWYMSPETHRTGKITLPLPGEQPAGGHAMCVVGYVDDDTVPGGGYFIVRNSWGAKWAAESPEAPGHALMPYDYVERFAMEAFTGPSAVVVAATETPSETAEWRDFIRTLQVDEPESRRREDLKLRLLKPGTKVIANPSQPEWFREDTPENRQEFLRLDRAWTPETRARVWFPARADWPADFGSDLLRIQTAKQAFLAAVEDNLKTAVKTLFPDINLPYRISLLPWQPRIREVRLEADLTSDLVAGMARSAGFPPELSIPAEWQEQFATVNALRVYSVHAASALMHVVVAFMSPVSLGQGRPLSFAVPSTQDVGLIRRLISEAKAAFCRQRPVFVFYTIGGASTWLADPKSLFGGDFCVFLSRPTGGKEWDTVTPPLFASRSSFRNFLDRLRPLTRQDRISKVKTAVDNLLADGFQGNITLDKVKKLTGYRRTQIRDAFLAIQEFGDYKVYWMDGKKGGMLAIGAKVHRPGPAVTPADFRSSWFLDHVWLIAWFFIAASISLLRESIVGLVGASVHAVAFVMTVVFMYITAMIQKQWERLKPEKE